MSIQSKRVPNGGRIERKRKVSFTFDGKVLTGYHGDTLAAALLANGITLVGRSFKYHRPRGILSAGAEEPNALVTLGVGGRRTPNLPATMLELSEGMAAESQNRWPSLSFDIQSLNGLFAPFLQSGFYYKTFMGPTRRAWMVYEHFIRKAAGLGSAAATPDPDIYDVRHAFCDVAVIGSGPAGLSAVRAAASAGARVTLIEQDFLFGGRLLSEPANGPAAAWLDSIIADVSNMGGVNLMPATTAFGVYDGNMLGLIQRPAAPLARGEARQTFTMLRAGAIVFATGAIERPLIFPNNDRPGVMLASAARTYLNRFAVLPGKRILIATSTDSAYQTGFDLAEAGAKVVVADLRSEIPTGLMADIERLGIELHSKTEIIGAKGRLAVKGASLRGAECTWNLACDLICMSGGWTPTVHLTSHLGIKPVYRDEIDGFVPGALPGGQYAAGAITGSYSTADAIAQGHKAGLTAAASCGHAGPAHPLSSFDLADAPARHCKATGVIRGKAFVDFQMDVTVGDIALAHREGYESVEHLKRYTTLGMGTDQGKTSNFAALSAMAALRHASIADTGTTTFRPPYTPIAVGALAGRAKGHHFRPIRRTPMHGWHLANGAEMLEVGLWMRPYFYRRSGRDVGEAYINEMRNVREAAGLMDISTLGKIDIQGPDAPELLNRVYANGYAKLSIGKARYGVMLRDDGIVFDDGTTTRLSDTHFFMTTSTAKAADVMSHLEFLLDTAWPDLRVAVTSVSDEWAAMSVAGPQSRRILAAACPQLDVSNDGLPQMGMLEAEFHGQPLRILRLSYSGERAYEIYVGATAGEALWCHLLDVGEPLGLMPYGVEALGALRIEKGHVAGPEIDGRTTLDDLGLGRMTRKRRDFVGDVLRQRPAFTDEKRQRLVGLEPIQPSARLRSGALLFLPGDTQCGHGRGRVTSITYSPERGHYVGLALLAADVAEENTEILAVHPIKSETVRVRVVSPVFLDPEGERLHG